MVRKFGFEVLEFGDKSFDVFGIRVEFLALRDRIEDTKVRGGIDAATGGPLPTAVVAGLIPVDHLPVMPQEFGTYDDELLDRHFVTELIVFDIFDTSYILIPVVKEIIM